MTEFELSKGTRDRSLKLHSGERPDPPLHTHPFVARILAGDTFTQEELRQVAREQRQKAAMRIARCMEKHGDDCPKKGRCPHNTKAVHKLLAYAEEA